MLILLGVALSGFFLVDPLYGGALTKSGVAKFVVLALVGGPLLLHYIGRMHANAAGWRRSLADVARAWWPVTLLGLFITCGSLYARQAESIVETFLNVGLGMLFLPLMALAVDSSGRKLFFLRGLLVVYLLTSMTMLVVAGANLHVLHEQIFWAVPVGMYLIAARGFNPIKLLTGLALVGASLFAFKNTTFLLVVMCLAAWALLLFLRMGRQTDRLKAWVWLYFTVLVVVAVVAAGAVAWWLVRDTLPHGNTPYRIEMYGIAWRRFLASPIWGTLFTEPSVTFFRLYKVAVSTQYLPTHSDILDLLAHGGLIAISLWLATVWRILRISANGFTTVARGAADTQSTAWRWLLVLALAEVGAIVTYAVNPPLIRLVDGFWIWGGAGVLWAFHRYLLANPGLPIAARPQHVRAWGIKPLDLPRLAR